MDLGLKNKTALVKGDALRDDQNGTGRCGPRDRGDGGRYGRDIEQYPGGADRVSVLSTSVTKQTGDMVYSEARR
jgi:hypothetical protein